MDYRLKYVIKETSTNTTQYTIERISDGVLRDISVELLLSSIDEIDGIKIIDGKAKYNGVNYIQVYNMKNTGGKLIQGLNDLETYCKKHNKQEWLDFYNNANNDLPANMVTYSSNKKFKVKCTHCGYERELMLNTFINQQEYACVACQSTRHSKCMSGVNDLYTYCKKNNMEYLIEEYNDNIDIHNIGYGSDNTVSWKCKYGHEWKARPCKRTSGQGCPYCKGSQTSKTERAICNWLKENNVKIIERDKIDGEEFDINIVDYNILIEVNSDATHATPEKIEKDNKKHEIAKRLNKKFIVLMQSCFPYLDDSLYYDIAFKSDKRNYLDELISDLKIKLKEYGLDIETTISKKALAGANKNAVPFERSLLGVYPDIADIWSDKNEVRPELIFAKSRRYIYLKCNKHDNEYSVRADSLANTYQNSRGCVYCSGKLPIKGENDLLTLEPELCRDWNDIDIRPDEVTLHSNKVVNWKCQFCGHEWRTMINNRTGVNKTGCPRCNQQIIKDEDVINNSDF